MGGVDRTPRARLAVATDDDTVSLSLDGELDMASLPDIEAALDALLTRSPGPLRIDVAGLEFLDSSGMAVLIRLANHFTPVETHHATGPVRRVIEVLGLADRLGLAGR